MAEGYPRLQVKLGGRAVEVDIATLRKVWEVIRGSRMRLAADGNRSWNTRDALRLSRECADTSPSVRKSIPSAAFRVSREAL